MHNETLMTSGGEDNPAAGNEWSKMAEEVTPFDGDVYSYYRSNAIPTNPNGDLVLDPNASQLPRDEKGHSLLDSYAVTTEKDANFLKAAEKIKLSNGDAVNSELLKRCLTIDAYYSSAKQQMLKEKPLRVLSAAKLYYDDVEDIRQGRVDIGGGDSIISKNDLVKGLMALEESGQLSELSETGKERLEEFKEIASPKAFIDKTHGAQYETIIDDKQCALQGDDVLDFLFLPSDELEKTCTTDPDGKIGQLTKTEFAYAAAKYLGENKVIDNYALPDALEDRINHLMSGELIDFSAVNKLMETHDTLYKKADLNPELRSAIFEQMPEDASSLEKAAYIYIKMCTLLTYDNKFMAANQKGEAAKRHKNIEYVSQITPENNEVVCFEFNIIYAKMLNELGLNFESEYEGIVGEYYGEGHAYLTFRDDKYIVTADSVSSILHGDIARVKMGLPLAGFKCESKNEQTQREFQDSVSKMYDLVLKQEREKGLKREYDSLTENLKPVEFAEKQSLLLEKLRNTSLSGIDAMSYALKLRKVLFSEQEQKDNASVAVVRNNGVISEGPQLEACAIIALNNAGFDKQPETTSYFYLSSRQELAPLTLDEIQAKLNNGTFEYIQRKDPRIPGATITEKQEGR
jgi:hypothetical protein